MLDTEIGNIDTELDNVKSSGAAISTAQTNGANTKTKIDLIPSNSAGNGVADWTYAAPINANPTSGTITSTFPSELGSINDADAGTYIHNAYHEVDVSLDVINSVASAADSFGNSIATFQGAVSVSAAGGFQCRIHGDACRHSSSLPWRQHDLDRDRTVELERTQGCQQRRTLISNAQ